MQVSSVIACGRSTRADRVSGVRSSPPTARLNNSKRMSLGPTSIVNSCWIAWTSTRTNRFFSTIQCRWFIGIMIQQRKTHINSSPHPTARTETTQTNRENFADMVSYMDTVIGRIVNKTVEMGIADRTLILVTGDNGTYRSIKSNIGDKVIVGGKGRPTDAGTHVALIAYQPGHSSSRSDLQVRCRLLRLCANDCRSNRRRTTVSHRWT